jgi:hypothetical protein
MRRCYGIKGFSPTDTCVKTNIILSTYYRRYDGGGGEASLHCFLQFQKAGDHVQVMCHMYMCKGLRC